MKVKVAENHQDFSLDRMWSAFHHSVPRVVENSPNTLTNSLMVHCSCAYKTEERYPKRGEGVGAAVTTTFGYDYQGNRVYQQTASTTVVYPSKYFSEEINGVNGTSTSYVYAGDTLVAEIFQKLVSGVATGTPTTYYVHPDHLGSISVLSDASGTPVSIQDFYPFGEQRVSENTGVFTQNKGYIGNYLDSSNLIYDNARYYDPARGQFLSEEPIFQSLGDANTVTALSGQNQQSYLSDPQLLNSYSYGRDNPVTNKDTNGELVELYSRPIQGPLGAVGAHTFIGVVPEVGESLSSVSGANTGRPFTLGGYTTGQGDLFKQANADPDYSDAFGGQNYGVAQVVVNPPAGMTQQQFDQAVVNSYNNLPDVLSDEYGQYGFMGQKRLTGHPNSNNTATSILVGAGVSIPQINSYQGTLYANNFRITPGVGTPASAPTYGQSIDSGLNSTLNALKGALTQLLGVLSSRK